ncbi:Uma2 family endonuclease [Peribacillus muralis]|uniref:Uma2 family endonuclease n=1 Tax=Peribacillus muralis TaxID=264697 RepID=UPI001F4E52B0|nr:Uma2 family endonuclease [Peribacillus muralis]MCK1994818.1 Uma2 family endonuclease [Peribacillus muralis]MCK2015355.1 Uma2 family endonuclease [Peribacillus muralis]
MSLPKGNFVTYEEYEEMKKSSEHLMEYIDGVVYMSPSPSPDHQRTSMKLSLVLGNLLE